MGIAERYRAVAAEVAAACAQAGRDPSEVTLIAVSKTVGCDGVAQAMDGGARAFGENRPDQLVPKAAGFPQAAWHFIGNIQSRRIRDIVGSATLIHSLCEMRHARKIDAAAADLGKIQEVLIEVNVSGELSKSGIAPGDALAMVRECAALPHVQVRGLMTMAPQGDRAYARQCFQELVALADQLRAQLPSSNAQAFDQISAGMSEDWEEAIAAGSTIVRLGRAIFSEEFE